MDACINMVNALQKEKIKGVSSKLCKFSFFE